MWHFKLDSQVIFLLYRNIRPLGYFAADEKYDVLKELVPIIDAEVKDIKAGGVYVKTSSGNLYHIMVNTFTMSMVDGKAGLFSLFSLSKKISNYGHILGY